MLTIMNRPISGLHAFIKKFKVNFDQLAPPSEGVKNRIEGFLELPDVTRSFSCLIQSEPPESQEDNLVMSKKSSASFSLSDLEDESPIKKARDPPKTRTLPLRSKNVSKRKKVEEAIEISDSPMFLDFDEAVKLGNTVMEQMVRSHNEKVQALEESNKQLVIKDQEMANLRKELSEKDSIHTKRLEEVVADANKKLEEVVAEAKNSALIAILEARIKMADEATKDGFNISIWNVECWKTKLGRLKGEDPEDAMVEFQKTVGDVTLGEEGCDKKA